MTDLNEQNGQKTDAASGVDVKRLVSRFTRAARSMRRVVEELQEVYPEAHLYLANDTMNLMKGPSHGAGAIARPLHENVITWESLGPASGGDW